MPVKGMTQEEIDAATRAQVAAGAKSTDRANRLEGETATEANARITAAYKEMTAKPILPQEVQDAGVQVKFVRTEAGGVGEYQVIKPIGYTGPPVKITEFTPGVIPANVKKTTGTSVGFNPDDYKDAEDLQRVQAKVAQGKVLTPDEQAFLNKGITIAAKPVVATAAKVYSSAELQDIIRKIGRGETLTADEKIAIGMTPAPVGPTGVTATKPTGTTVTGTTPTGTTVTATSPTGTTATGTGPTGTTATGTGPTGTTVIATSPTGTTVTATSPTVLTYKATDSTVFTDQAAYVAYQKMLNDAKTATAEKSAADLTSRQSAYDLLYSEFNKYGLGSLVTPLKNLIQSGASPAEFSIKLRDSDAYQQRFAANKMRIAKGLTAINEATYIGLEDQYQNIMRNAGLPESYWKQTVDPITGIKTQEGFTQLIANDVSNVELEDRISTAQKRIIYANPEVGIALKTFYPDISNGDLLAYALDPTKGLEQIKRRITAAEIGSSAVQLGLTTNVTDAEYLARYGVTKEQAQKGYRTAAEILPTATKLSEIYATQGVSPYTQTTAEQEIFNVPGAAEAAKQRKKLVGLEQATFAAKSGAAQGALARERAGGF